MSLHMLKCNSCLGSFPDFFLGKKLLMLIPVDGNTSFNMINSISVMICMSFFSPSIHLNQMDI